MNKETEDVVKDINFMAEQLIKLYKDTGKRPYYVFCYNEDTDESSEMCKQDLATGRKFVYDIVKNNKTVRREWLKPPDKNNENHE